MIGIICNFPVRVSWNTKSLDHARPAVNSQTLYLVIGRMSSFSVCNLITWLTYFHVQTQHDLLVAHIKIHTF